MAPTFAQRRSAEAIRPLDPAQGQSADRVVDPRRRVISAAATDAAASVSSAASFASEAVCRRLWVRLSLGRTWSAVGLASFPDVGGGSAPSAGVAAAAASDSRVPVGRARRSAGRFVAFLLVSGLCVADIAHARETGFSGGGGAAQFRYRANRQTRTCVAGVAPGIPLWRVTAGQADGRDQRRGVWHGASSHRLFR